MTRKNQIVPTRPPALHRDAAPVRVLGACTDPPPAGVGAMPAAPERITSPDAPASRRTMGGKSWPPAPSRLAWHCATPPSPGSLTRRVARLRRFPRRTGRQPSQYHPHRQTVQPWLQGRSRRPNPKHGSPLGHQSPGCHGPEQQAPRHPAAPCHPYRQCPQHCRCHGNDDGQPCSNNLLQTSIRS